MCTTDLCIAFYILTFAIGGWFGVLAIVLINKAKHNPVTGTSAFSLWMTKELGNPINCFKAEVIKPFIADIANSLRYWNKEVGSKPELSNLF